MWTLALPGEPSLVALRESPDGGRTWSPMRELDRVPGTCDSPTLVLNPENAWAAWRLRSVGTPPSIQLRHWRGPSMDTGAPLPLAIGMDLEAVRLLPSTSRAVDVYAVKKRGRRSPGRIQRIRANPETVSEAVDLFEPPQGLTLLGLKYVRSGATDFALAEVARTAGVGTLWTAGPGAGLEAWPALSPLTAEDEWIGGGVIAATPERVVAIYEEGSLRPMLPKGKLLARSCRTRDRKWSAPVQYAMSTCPPALTTLNGIFYSACLDTGQAGGFELLVHRSRDGARWFEVLRLPWPDHPGGLIARLELASAGDGLVVLEVTETGNLLAVPLTLPSQAGQP
jgi:hypothetical protein